MPSLADRISRPVALLLSPILLAQGRVLRRTMPVLPEAAGPRHGTIAATMAASSGRHSGPGNSGDERMLSLLVFGESTAAGVGAASQEDGIVGALARRLATAETGVSWAVTARTGYTASTARAKLLKHVRGQYDLIVVLLGVNDSLGLTRRALWSAHLSLLLTELEPHLESGGRIVCAGVPPMTEFRALPQPTRMAIGRHARTLDHALSELVESAERVSYVDSPIPVGAGLLATDGFHPSPAGYERWAEHIVTTLHTRGDPIWVGGTTPATPGIRLGSEDNAG